MKFAETKIYLKFIAWFLLVAITPLIILLVIFFKFYPGSTEFGMPLVANSTILISLFSALAAVLVLAILATRHLSQLVSRPVRSSIEQLLKVVKAINKSIDNLAIITKDNHQITKFLSSTAQTQQKGLRTGNVAVKEIVQSLSAIAQKVSITTQNTKSIDKLADDSEDKAQAALSSLVAV